MPTQPKTEDQSLQTPEDSSALVDTTEVRRIVVSSEQVFQGETRPFRLVSLESVVLRYALLSGAIIATLVVLGLIWWFLLRRG